MADSQPDEETGPVLVPTASAAESEETVDASAPSGLVAPAEAPEAVGPVPLATADSAEPKGPTPAAAATRPAPPAKTGSGPKKPPPKRPKKKTPRTAPAPTAPQVPVPAATAPPPPPPVTGPSERKGRGRRPQPRGVVRGLAGVIMILLGAGTAVALERNQASDTQAETAGRGGPTDDGAPKPEAATASQIAGADIIGEWLMTLAVFESTGFFGTQVGQSVEKTYTIRSDCSAAPCVLRLAVSGTTGEYELRKQPQEYLLLATGPQDCIDLPTGAVRVPNGGVASVTVHLRPTTASRTPRGDWMATGLSGSVVTTFDTSNPACVQGSGVQRSTAVGVRQ